jgi:hypothetical protein
MRTIVLCTMVGIMSLASISGIAYAKGTHGNNGGRGGHTGHAGRVTNAHHANPGRGGRQGVAARPVRAGNNHAGPAGNRGRAANRPHGRNGNHLANNGNNNGRNLTRHGPNAQHANPGRRGYAGARQGQHGRYGRYGRPGLVRGRYGYLDGDFGYRGRYGYPGWYGYPGASLEVIDDPDTEFIQPRLMWPAVNPPISPAPGTVTVGSTAPADDGPAIADETFPDRFLRVKNTTGEPMKVFVQFHTEVGEDDWKWVPADPKHSSKSMMVQVAAGAEVMLADKEGPIPADRVRIWAVGPSKRMTEYQNRDLWLVPEVNEAGEHVYQAAEIETFTYVLR